MAFRCTKLLRILRTTIVLRQNSSTKPVIPNEGLKSTKQKQFKTETNFVYLEDPDNFGTLSKTIRSHSEELEDKDDIREEEFLQNAPVPSQKLTNKQYADLIKQYLKHKRLKEAFDVLEIRMLKEDKVKPVNYIYNILIGACADVGYTKKAFNLFNDMKRRALKPTGDTYTCLFNACANSPWPEYGLKNALHLKELMIEKKIEPNLTNYNAMIKAFGWCGDLGTAFKIVDEMMEKRIKIRVQTFNHLLHACISDKSNGLRHALIVWRKMLKMKQKPNIYTFNLMLKCVKDCNLGSKEDIIQLVDTIHTLIPVNSNLQRKLTEADILSDNHEIKLIAPGVLPEDFNKKDSTNLISKHIDTSEKEEGVIMEFVNKLEKVDVNRRTVPNLLSKVLNMTEVTALQAVNTVQDKFSVVGGQDDFLKEMQEYSIKPNVKTFTQMLPLLENSTEAENKMLTAMRSLEINGDIDFYNMLIKKRCFRFDYDAAFDVMEIIKKESEFRKKRYPHSKKLKLNANIMTYGVLAMACKTKVEAENLINKMNEKRLKVNIEILGALLRQGTANTDINYVLYVMNIIKQENIQINSILIKHLENFNDKCSNLINKKHGPDIKQFKNFTKYYSDWLKDRNIEDVLSVEHPWKQFQENQQESMQRDKVVINPPKKFYKRNRKFKPYVP